MILSYKSGFIFLKAIKTASTSVEIALSKYCGPADIITELPDPDETLRRGLGYRGPQNHLNSFGRQLLGQIRREDKNVRRFKYHHNLSAAAVRRAIGVSQWDRMLTISVSRNPFDRAISKFYHDHRHLQWEKRRSGTDYDSETISQYICGLPDIDLTNWHTYADGNELIVRRVMRYENLVEELDSVVKELGLGEPVALPNAKGNFRLSRENYRNVLTAEARSRIEMAARQEMEHFGYRW